MIPKTLLRRTPIITSSRDVMAVFLEQVDCSPHLWYRLCAINQQSGEAVYEYFFTWTLSTTDKRGDYKSKQ